MAFRQLVAVSIERAYYVLTGGSSKHGGEAMAKGKISKATVEALAVRDTDVYLWDTKLAGYGVKVTPAGRRVYLVQYRQGGRSGRTRRVTIGAHGAMTEAQARAEAKRLLGQVHAGQDPASDRDRIRAALTLSQALEHFLSAHADAKLRSSTASEYRRLVKLHIPQRLRGRILTEISRTDIARLHDGLRDRPYQANRLLAVLSKFFNWCEANDLRPDHSNPCRHVSKFREKNRERFLSAQELARLGEALHLAETEGLPWDVDENRPTAKHLPKPENRISVVSPFATAAIRLLIFTGARHSEILSLKWSQVDFAAHQLRLDESKTGRKSIYLSAPALEVLASLPRFQGNDYVICGQSDKRYLTNLKRAWMRIRKAADLEDVRIHDLRHTFASWGATGGLPLQIIGGLLGQSKPQTTQRYAHLSADPLKAAAERVAGALAGAMRSRPPEPLKNF